MANLNDVINDRGSNLTVNQICKNLRLDFWSAIREDRGRKILTVWRFERALQRDVFRFRSFTESGFLRKDFRAGYAILVSSHDAYCESVMLLRANDVIPGFLEREF